MPETTPSTRPPARPARPSLWRLWPIVLLLLLLYLQFAPWRAPAEFLTYSQLETQLDQGNVDSVLIVPENRGLSGTLKTPIRIDTREVRNFRVVLPFTDAAPLVARLEARGVAVEGGASSSGWAGILIGLVPWVLIGAVWYYFLRQARAGGAQALAFGRARTGLASPETPQITFADVANVEEAKTELKELVEFLRNPGRFQRLGGRLPKGVLLVGAPGTGKTLLARATAGEAARPFLTISGSDFVELFVGVGAARVRDLFAQGKAHAPCIIFIDELDAVGRTRGMAALTGTHEEREQTLNQLLVEMDGFEPSEGIILLAATNRPDVLDPALLRPGRFDRRIMVELPDVKGREQILRIHARKVPVAPGVDLAALARGTPGLSGADLANLVNEAALLAARRQEDQVEQQDFEDARDKVTLGIERRSLVLTDAERRLTACHEAGHALVNLLTPGQDPVQKVSIVPRGAALGLTFTLPEEDRRSYSRDYLLGRLAVAQAGRAAEELVFGPEKVTTGAAQDFAQATELARRMVMHFGMSPAVGPVAIGEHPVAAPFGPEFPRPKDGSEETARMVDREVRSLLVAAADRARTLLQQHRALLERLAGELLEHETLDRAALTRLMGGAGVPAPAGPAAPAPVEIGR